MAADLELLSLMPDGQSSQATEKVSEAIGDAILRTMGALSEHNRRDIWVQECQTQVTELLKYACHLRFYFPLLVNFSMIQSTAFFFSIDIARVGIMSAS
jgi:hypothetical protein